MLGIIRVRCDENAPRARTERLETLGGVPFQTAVLQVRSTTGALDCRLMRQSLRLLAQRGVVRAATPPVPYIKEAMERYHIENMGHSALLRAMASQITDHVLRGAADGAVLLYARKLDADVLAAARHAARRYRTVVLDFGSGGEMVRRRLMDEYGTAALLGQVAVRASRSAVLLFDKPAADFGVRLPHPIMVAFYSAAESADVTDVRVACPLYEPLGDTDREAVLGALLCRNAGLVREMEIVGLVKK